MHGRRVRRAELTTMRIVRVDPAGLDLAVEEGESVADAAWRQGYTWPTKCWGQAECMVCAVRITSGGGSVVPPSDVEENALRTLMSKRLRRPDTRLACQLRISGDGVVLDKAGVAPPEGMS